MNTKHGLLTLALVGIVSLNPVPAFSGNLDRFSDALENLSEMTRAADRAHDALEDAMRGGSSYDRYDRDWRNAESRLERERVRTMAHIAGVSESRIRSLRDDGHSWDSIARKYHIDPHRFGYGNSRYDLERDKWKGVPPGLAKKGGMPPGQARKAPHNDKKDAHPGHGKKFDDNRHDKKHRD